MAHLTALLYSGCAKQDTRHFHLQDTPNTKVTFLVGNYSFFGPASTCSFITLGKETQSPDITD